MSPPKTFSSEELESRLRKLPRLPSVIGELIALDPSNDDYTSRVNEIAAREPALAGRLLSVANGAMSAPANQITTLHDALVRLGARRVSTLVTSFAVMQVFVPINKAQRDLWRHAILTAVGAQEIAARCSWDVAPQLAYVAGLLHDVGSFVLCNEGEPPVSRGEIAEWNTPPSLSATARKNPANDHCTVGWMAARIWNLPLHLSEVMRFHHHHGPFDDKVSALGRPLIRIVQQADCLSYLLIRHAKQLTSVDSSKLERILAQHCICPDWGEPPVSGSILAELLPEVSAKSLAQVASLSLTGS